MTNSIQHQPQISKEIASEFLKQTFGLEAKLSSLDSERDQNFLVTLPLDDSQWVLKIANLEADRSLLELENAVMQLFAESPLARMIPSVHPNQNGDLISELEFESGTSLTRLVEFLPGRVLADVRPQSPALLRELGKMLGQFTHAMQDFDSAAANPELRKDFHWNLDRFEQTVEEIGAKVPKIDLLTEFVERHESRVIPIRTGLRKSLIQNDANDHNVIVSAASVWPQQISGLIDFGDMCYASTINELAIAIAYVMLDKSDPLRAAAYVVEGFHAEFPLTESELEILFDLACARSSTRRLDGRLPGIT